VSNTKSKAKSVVRRLGKGHPVPCDGKIYRDSDGQLWFGIEYKLNDENRFIELLNFVEQIEKEGPL
jgi:hypothetical protein